MTSCNKRSYKNINAAIGQERAYQW